MAVNFKFTSDSINKYRELSDKIKENLIVDGNNIKENESHSSYYANLPNGITKEDVEKISKYNSEFITASHIAVGELAAGIFNNNKKIEEVNASVGFFGKKDNIDMTIYREKVYTNHLAPNGPEEVKKNLVFQTTINTSSTRGIGLKSIREEMSKEFANTFKK